RRHTGFSRDWSSDVCSSDLKAIGHPKDRLEYHKDFTPEDHKDAYLAHMKAAERSKDFKSAQEHRNAAMFHHQSSLPKRSPTPKSASTVKVGAAARPPRPTKHTSYGEIKKGMGLGSGMGAPSTFTDGAAVSKEDLKLKAEKLAKGADRSPWKQKKIASNAHEKSAHFNYPHGAYEAVVTVIDGKYRSTVFNRRDGSVVHRGHEDEHQIVDVIKNRKFLAP